jgi:hypothetical protein
MVAYTVAIPVYYHTLVQPPIDPGSEDFIFV